MTVSGAEGGTDRGDLFRQRGAEVAVRSATETVDGDDAFGPVSAGDGEVHRIQERGRGADGGGVHLGDPVHIGSIAGRVASPGLGPYAATKHSVAALNWSLRAELARVGRMNSSVVEPGEIKTAIWDKAPPQIDDTVEKLERAGLMARYEWLLDMIRGFVAEANEKAIDPDKVAEAVEHALTSKRPKARYLIGTDAKVQAKLALLPDRAREFALSKLHAIYIKNGAKLRPDNS